LGFWLCNHWESDKTSGSGNVSGGRLEMPTLEINLFTKASDNTEYKVDGTVLNVSLLSVTQSIMVM
jgi:hypothetical protein